ncbi:hypothetical protein F4777DRAFT_578642 [Nemania sp. FL0916]|nr:hypothetical protein F4777DRAFT_578642 [Nemania sp. FL0916]
MENAPDFNFSEPLGFPDDTFNLFPGMGFDEPVDCDFETRLAHDFPTVTPVPEGHPSQPVPLSSEEQQRADEPANGPSKVPSLSPPDLINGSLQETIDPSLTYNGVKTIQPQDPSYLDDTKLDWALLQQQLQGGTPANKAFNAQEVDSQVCSPYPPRDGHMNGQQMAQPTPNQFGAWPMPGYQQPMGYAMDGQQMYYQQPMNTGYQAPWGPMGQMNQYPPQYPPSQYPPPQYPPSQYPPPQYPPPQYPQYPPQQYQSHQQHPNSPPEFQPIPQYPMHQNMPQPLTRPVSPASQPQLVPPPASLGALDIRKFRKRVSVPVDERRESEISMPHAYTRYSKGPPSPGTITTSPPVKRPEKNHHGQPLLNDRIPRRTHGNKVKDQIEPERYYGPSPARPKDWGPLDRKGNPLFSYTDKGELSAGLYFTARQMRQYLMGPSKYDNFAAPPRLPGVKHSNRKLRQGLTLWIGWPAAMANSRYPRGGESTKCRFADCQYHSTNTIQLGDPWVILDERQNANGEAINPFHNAGYVHLYCLEHHFDIVELWHCIDIRFDYRSFKRESHPYFSLSYKLPGIESRVQLWWLRAFADWESARGHGRKRLRSHETSLAECLVEYKLIHEPTGQSKNREKRGGADMSKHRGDPQLKKQLIAMRKHGLLDDDGYPLPGAAERLAEIEARSRPGRRRRVPPENIPLPPAKPHYQPYYQQGAGPVNVLPAYPVANPVYPTYPIPQAANPVQVLSPPAQVRGRKRAQDEADIEGSSIQETATGARQPLVSDRPRAPSLKRRRVEEPAPPAGISSGDAGSAAAEGMDLTTSFELQLQREFLDLSAKFQQEQDKDSGGDLNAQLEAELAEELLAEYYGKEGETPAAPAANGKHENHDTDVQAGGTAAKVSPAPPDTTEADSIDIGSLPSSPVDSLFG